MSFKLPGTLLKKDTVILSIMYCLGNGLMLLNDGIYMDDWIYYGWDPGQMIAHFSQFGNVYLGHLYNFMFTLPDSVLVFRAIVFLAFLFAGLLLNDTLRRMTPIDASSRVVLVLLFLLLPVNGGRILLCTFMYSASYFLFFLGLWLTALYLETGRTWPRLLAIPVFFLSFFTNSLLLFYAVAILLLAYRKLGKVTLRNAIRLVAGHLDYFVLPFVFWIIKVLYFQPYGCYAGYNQITPEAILHVPVNFAVFLMYSGVFGAIRAVYNFAHLPALLALALLAVAYLAVRKVYTPRNGGVGESKADLPWFAFGLLCILLAVLAYLVIGKIPTSTCWENRHQLLLPLGASFSLYFGLRMLFARLKAGRGTQVLVLAVLVLLCLGATVADYVAYQKETFKRAAEIRQMGSSSVIRDATTFLFADDTAGYSLDFGGDPNGRGKAVGYYEFTAMMADAFGDETRFGCDVNLYADRYDDLADKVTYPDHDYYDRDNRFSEYVDHSPEYLVTVVNGDYDLNYDNLVRLMYYEYFDRAKYDETLGRIVKLEYEKVDDGTSVDSLRDADTDQIPDFRSLLAGGLSEAGSIL